MSISYPHLLYTVLLVFVYTIYMSMFSDPKKNIEQLGIQPGMNIADLGAGSGFHTIELAKSLAGTGLVYAVDIQKDLLTKIKNNGAGQNLYNIEVVWGDIEKLSGTKIKDATIDLVLLSNILFQVEDKKGVIEESKRILVPGGRVAIVDWSESFGGIGPHQDQVVTKQSATGLFEQAGFALEREISTGSHHYGLIFKKL